MATVGWREGKLDKWEMKPSLNCTEIDSDGDGKYEVQVGEGCTVNG